MTGIPDSLRLLFETSMEEENDRYVVPVPKELVEESDLSPEDSYRVALLAAEHAASDDSESGTAGSDSSASTSAGRGPDRGHHPQGPPVEEGEVRQVTIDTLGDQGDGLAKVERGFIVIVPGTQPGDQVRVRITEVKETVAFAEPLEDPTVR